MIHLSIALPGFDNLLNLGLLEHLSNIYGSNVALSTNKEADYELTVSFNKSILDGKHLTMDLYCLVDSMIKKLSLLRMNMMTLPLILAREQQERGETGPLMVLPLRSKDCMYVQAQGDRITVIYATRFEDPSDEVLGKVFMQELFDTRQQKSNLQNAPAVILGKTPPKEVASLIQSTSSDMNYITFSKPYINHITNDSSPLP